VTILRHAVYQQLQRTGNGKGNLLKKQCNNINSCETIHVSGYVDTRLNQPILFILRTV